MADENDNVEIAVVSAEAAAAEALASVAETAIEETAHRVAELTEARAEIAHLRNELAEMQTAFLAHVEDNTVNFDSLRRDHSGLQERIAMLEAALISAEEEIREMEAEVEIVADGVEDVATAQAAETSIERHEHHEHERETEQPRVRSRHFIRI